MEIKNYETLGMRPPSLQMTHNALSVVDVTISSDVIKETLVIMRSSAFSNNNDPNHDLLWQNNKPNEPEQIIQISSKTNYFSLSSLVSL